MGVLRQLVEDADLREATKRIDSDSASGTTAADFPSSDYQPDTPDTSSDLYRRIKRSTPKRS